MSRSTLNKILSFYNVDKDLFAEAANTGDQNMNLSSQSIINAFCQSVSEKFVALHTQTHTLTLLFLHLINTINLIYKYLDRFIFSDI